VAEQSHSHFTRSSVAEKTVWSDVFHEPRHDAVSYLTVYLILLLLIPSSLAFTPLGGMGTPADVWSLIIVLWYLASWIIGKATPPGSGKPVIYATLAFALAVLASFVAGMTRDITPVEVLAGERGLLSAVAWAGLIMVICWSVTSYDRLDTLLRRAVILGSIVAGIGIFEFYSGINITSYLHIPGLSDFFNQNTLESRAVFNRPSSTGTDPIEFSVVMAMLLPFALQQALGSPREKRLRRWLPVVLITFAILITLSRSGILAAAAGILVLLPTWKLRQIAALAVVLPIGLFVAWTGTPGLIGTIRGLFLTWFAGTDPSTQSRAIAVSADWSYVSARPIFGRGYGTFLPQIYAYTDNMYLQMLITAGIIGLAALVALYLTGIYCSLAGRQRAYGERRRSFGQAITASLVAAAIGSATFDSLGFAMYSGVLILILGVAGAYYTQMKREHDYIRGFESAAE
jgi:O-Antigen ligase